MEPFEGGRESVDTIHKHDFDMRRVMSLMDISKSYNTNISEGRRGNGIAWGDRLLDLRVDTGLIVNQKSVYTPACPANMPARGTLRIRCK